MKKNRNKLIAIQMEDGRTAIMQTFEDVIIDAEIRRAALPSPPVSWREINDADADRIRKDRPKPTKQAVENIQAGSSGDVDERIRLLAQHVLDLTTRHDEMATAYAALKERTEYIEEKALAKVDLMEGK